MSNNDRPTTIFYWLLLLAAAVTIRVVVTYCLFGDWKQSSDAAAYANQARNIAAGRWTYPCSWPVGRSAAIVPFLWVFGPTETVIKANAIAFDVGCVFLTAVLSHQTLSDGFTARLAGWIAAFYPPMILLSGWSYADNVTMFFLLALAILAIAACRNRTLGIWRSLAIWFAAGCSLGMAILTRPATQSILAFGCLACVVIWLVRRIRPSFLSSFGQTSWRRLMAAGTPFLVGVACCVLPIMRHNAALNAGWCVAVNSESNIFLGNNPYTPHYKTWHWGQHAPTGDVKAYFESVVGNGTNPRAAMLHEAVRYILVRPDVFLLRTANRIRAFWGFDYSVVGGVLNQGTAHGAKKLSALGKIGIASLFVANAGGYCFVALAAIAGLFLFRKLGAMDGRTATFLLGIVLAVQFPYALTHSNAAYHTPLVGFLFPFAAVAIAEARSWKTGACPTLIRSKWFWIVVATFIFIQLEYAYWIVVYH